MPKQKDQDGIYRREDSPYWWCSYRDASGKRARRSTGTTDRREAEALLNKWRVEAFEAEKWGRAPEVIKPATSFDQVMLAYLEGPAQTQRSGLKRIKATMKPLYQYFTGRAMNVIGDVDIKGYIRHRLSAGAAPATVNKEVGMFSAATNYVREELGWDVPNPAARKKLKEPDGIVRWITQDEARTLIHESAQEPRAPHLPDFAQLMLNTACRSGELLGLEWDRVDLRANLFILESEHNKAMKRHSVPLNKAAREALLNRARFRARHCPDSPWVFCNRKGERIASVRRSFAGALRRAGINNFRIHDGRHTVASWLVMDGVPLIEVRDVLRHSTVKMTERYAHLHPENVRATVGRIIDVSRFGHGTLPSSDTGEHKTESNG